MTEHYLFSVIDSAESDRELWGVQVRRQEEAMRENQARDLGIEQNFARANYAERNRRRRAGGRPELVNQFQTGAEEFTDQVFGPISGTEERFNQTGAARADAILAELKSINAGLQNTTRRPPVTVSED